MTEEVRKHDGGCHCGAVRFQVTLSQGFDTARRCTCSYRRMRGAVAVSARFGDMKITKGADKLSSYRFNTGAAQHFFCSLCGIYTHHQRRSNQAEYGINVACLDGVSNRYEDAGANVPAATRELWRMVRPSGTEAPGARMCGQADV